MKTKKHIAVLIILSLSITLCGCGRAHINHAKANIYGHLYQYDYNPFHPSGNSAVAAPQYAEAVPAEPESEYVQETESTEPVNEYTAEAESEDIKVTESVEPVSEPVEKAESDNNEETGSINDELEYPIDFFEYLGYCSPEEGLPAWVVMDAYSVLGKMIAQAANMFVTVYAGTPKEQTYPYVMISLYDFYGYEAECLWYIVVDTPEQAEIVYRDNFLPDSEYDNWGRTFGDVWKLKDNIIYGVVPKECGSGHTYMEMLDQLDDYEGRGYTVIYY